MLRTTELLCFTINTVCNTPVANDLHSTENLLLIVWSEMYYFCCYHCYWLLCTVLKIKAAGIKCQLVAVNVLQYEGYCT